MSDIWRGEKRRYELAGQVGDDGRVWFGELRKYDLAGEVDDEGNIWLGEKRRYELAGQVGDDGRVWFGELRKYDLAGEVDDEGNIWLGEKSGYQLVGQVDPPSTQAGAAGLILLLTEDRNALRGDLGRAVRGVASETAVALAVNVAATLLDPGRRHARRVQRQLRDLADREGREVQHAEHLGATGQSEEATKIAGAVAQRLDARIRAERDAEVLVRLRLMRAWAESVCIRAVGDAAGSSGSALLDEVAALQTSIPQWEVGLRQELAKLQLGIATALRRPAEAVAAVEDLCRLAPGERAYQEGLVATRAWAHSVEEQATVDAAQRALDALTNASQVLLQLTARGIEEASALPLLPESASDADGTRWATEAHAAQEGHLRDLGDAVAQLETALTALRQLRPKSSSKVADLIDEALESGAKTLTINKDDLHRRTAIVERLRGVVQGKVERTPDPGREVERLRASAESAQLVLADVQAELQRSAAVFNGTTTRAEAADARATLVRQLDRLIKLEHELRADVSAWETLPETVREEGARVLLDRQVESLAALKSALQRIIERVGQALGDDG